jgi:hypothetical protein
MFSRRAMLRQPACGLGLQGPGPLLAEVVTGGPLTPLLTPTAPHFPSEARRILVLFIRGGHLSLDTFDPKSRLTEDRRKPIPFRPGPNFAENIVLSLWDRRRDSGNTAGVEIRSATRFRDDIC